MVSQPGSRSEIRIRTAVRKTLGFSSKCADGDRADAAGPVHYVKQDCETEIPDRHDWAIPRRSAALVALPLSEATDRKPILVEFSAAESSSFGHLHQSTILNGAW